MGAFPKAEIDRREERWKKERGKKRRNKTVEHSMELSPPGQDVRSSKEQELGWYDTSGLRGNFAILNPCVKNWSDLEGEDRARFCATGIRAREVPRD